MRDSKIFSLLLVFTLLLGLEESWTATTPSQQQVSCPSDIKDLGLPDHASDTLPAKCSQVYRIANLPKGTCIAADLTGIGRDGNLGGYDMSLKEGEPPTREHKDKTSWSSSSDPPSAHKEYIRYATSSPSQRDVYLKVDNTGDDAWSYTLNLFQCGGPVDLPFQVSDSVKFNADSRIYMVRNWPLRNIVEIYLSFTPGVKLALQYRMGKSPDWDSPILASSSSGVIQKQLVLVGPVQEGVYLRVVCQKDCSADKGNFTLQVRATLPQMLPQRPSNLMATAFSIKLQIDLKWRDNSDNEDGFKVERKIGAEGSYIQIATVGANVTSYSDTALTPETTYYYRVRAYNAAGNSEYSNEASATIREPLYLVFLHGFASRGASMLPVVQAVVEQFHKRGYVSQLLGWSVKDYGNNVALNVWANNIAEEVRSIKPSRKNVVLIGHSAGGKAAVYAVAHIPGMSDRVAMIITYNSPHRPLNNYVSSLPYGIIGICKLILLLDDEGICKSLLNTDTTVDALTVTREYKIPTYTLRSAEEYFLSPECDYAPGLDSYPEVQDDGAVPYDAQWFSDPSYEDTYGNYCHLDHSKPEVAEILAYKILSKLEPLLKE